MMTSDWLPHQVLTNERQALLSKVPPYDLTIEAPAAFAPGGSGGVGGGGGDGGGGGCCGDETAMTTGGEHEGKRSPKVRTKDAKRAEKARADADQEIESLRARAVQAEAHVAELQRQLRAKASRLRQLGGGAHAGGVAGEAPSLKIAAPSAGRVGGGAGGDRASDAAGGGGGGTAEEGRAVVGLQRELEAKNAEIAEMKTQLAVLKDMVRARQADARTMEMQNARLRRKVQGGGGGGGGSGGGPNSPARPTNVMEQLPSE
jgi:hypothetical protein